MLNSLQRRLTDDGYATPYRVICFGRHWFILWFGASQWPNRTSNKTNCYYIKETQNRAVRIQYITENMHTVRVMSCFILVRYRFVLPLFFTVALKWRHNGAMASQITGFSIVCLTVCSGAGQRKHESYVSLAFAKGIHQWQVDSPHKGPVTRKMFPFHYVERYHGLNSNGKSYVCYYNKADK